MNTNNHFSRLIHVDYNYEEETYRYKHLKCTDSCGLYLKLINISVRVNFDLKQVACVYVHM